MSADRINAGDKKDFPREKAMEEQEEPRERNRGTEEKWKKLKEGRRLLNLIVFCWAGLLPIDLMTSMPAYFTGHLSLEAPHTHSSPEWLYSQWAHRSDCQCLCWRGRFRPPKRVAGRENCTWLQHRLIVKVNFPSRCFTGGWEGYVLILHPRCCSYDAPPSKPEKPLARGEVNNREMKSLHVYLNRNPRISCATPPTGWIKHYSVNQNTEHNQDHRNIFPDN